MVGLMSSSHMEVVMDFKALGRKLNDVVMNPEAQGDNADRLQEINREVYTAARMMAGVTVSDLADEAQENSPRVQHYWSLTSMYLANVYMAAAQQLTSWEERIVE